MAAKKRKQHRYIKQRLFDHGYEFNFFKAVHLLEGFTGGKSPGQGLSPAEEPIRFKVQPGFYFPASDIAAIQNGTNKDKAEVTVNFMGLIGPKGVLPDWYNEYAQQCRHEKYYAFTDFLDIFHNRSLALFYKAWKKYRLPETYRADHDDPISYSLRCLTGIEDETDTYFHQYTQQRLIYFSGMISRTVPTANAVEKIIGNAVRAPAEVEQFVPRIYPIHEKERTVLGRKNCGLKKDAMCGGHIRDIGTYFIVKLGPLSWKQYLLLQPRSRSLELVYQLIARIVGMTYEFEVHLIVKGDEIPEAALGSNKTAPMLGRSIRLGTRKALNSGNVVVKTFQKQFPASAHFSNSNVNNKDSGRSVRQAIIEEHK